MQSAGTLACCCCVELCQVSWPLSEGHFSSLWSDSITSFLDTAGRILHCKGEHRLLRQFLISGEIVGERRSDGDE